MDLIQWLHSPYADDPGYLIVDRLAELMAINGRTTAITKFGKQEATDENRYGKKGLLPHEAMELSRMSGAIGILSFMHPEQSQEFLRIVKEKMLGEKPKLIEVASEEQVTQFLKTFSPFGKQRTVNGHSG